MTGGRNHASSSVLPRFSEPVAARPAAAPRPPAHRLAQAARAAGAAYWAGYLAVCALLIAVAAATSRGEWQHTVLLSATGLLSAAAALAGVRAHRPQLACGWWLLAAALLVSAAGHAMLSVSGGTRGPDSGLLAGISDALHLASYPLMAGGLLVFVRRQDPGRNWPSVVDVLVVTTGAALLSWVFLIDPLAREPGMDLSERLVATAQPVLALLVLAIAVRLAVSLAARTPAVHLLGVALVALLASDGLLALGRLAGNRHGGLLVDVGWMVWHVAVGAAALHPSMRRLSEPPTGRGEAKLTTWRLALLAAASLTAPAAAWAQWVRGEQVSPPVFSIGSAVLFLLVLARAGGLAREVATEARARKLLLDRTVQAREEERVRVAADLHDGPIQRLAGLGYMVEVARLRIERADVAGGQKLLGTLREQISTEVEALRQLMAELRPPVLDEWGLPAALAAYASQFERHTGITCTLHVRLPGRLDAAQETVLYRVTQEALTNVRKHAAAGSVRVELSARNRQVELRISDDGVGFDVASIPDLLHRDHYGLAGIRQRVEMAGGACTVASRPGEGTTVAVTLPS